MRMFVPPMEAAARALNVRAFWKDFSGDAERDFAEMKRLGADSVVVGPGPEMFPKVAQVATLAKKHRLPTISGLTEFAGAGGLMAYGPSAVGTYRTGARFVSKILKGAKVGEIPIERPTVYELTINRGTARELGLELPMSVLMRADHVLD